MNPKSSGPTADAADAYLLALQERLTRDGCTVISPHWKDRPVVIGRRADRKARWFGTKTELFVFAAVVPEIDLVTLADFTGWSMSYAKSLRRGIPGARNAAMVLPALVSARVHTEAAQWAAQDARTVGATLIGRPLTVETLPEGVRVTMYRGQVPVGGLFTNHVLEKAALYFR
ncbi:hypothetical protein [Streptomyces sp. NPDC058193]|uniref:hypothetical protein n=1 Tax=Streptomyces sp. NPDC058193 TaxID=3346373 RepID=UPI0036E69891